MHVGDTAREKGGNLCVCGWEGGWREVETMREGTNELFTELRPLCVSNREVVDKADTGIL